MCVSSQRKVQSFVQLKNKFRFSVLNGVPHHVHFLLSQVFQ